MAEIDNILGDYQAPTRAQKVARGLRSASHKLASVPIMFVGLLTAPVVFGLSGLAALVETLDGFANRGFGDGMKSATSGTVDTVASTAMAATDTFGVITLANTFSWLGTENGATLPELAREGTNGIIDSAFPKSERRGAAFEQQVLGPMPMTNGYAPASVAYAPTMQQQMMPNGHMAPNGNYIPANYWTNGVADQRGVDRDAARQAYMSGNAQEYRELRSAAEKGPQEVGAS